MVSTLMLGTLVVAVLIGVFLLVRHMRKPENRHPMEGQCERTYEQMQNEGRRNSFPPNRDGN